MKQKLKNLSNAFREYYCSAESNRKSDALRDAIRALSDLCGAEDERQFAAEFIGSCGHIYDVKVIEMLMKEFRLTVGPAYRIMPE